MIALCTPVYDKLDLGFIASRDRMDVDGPVLGLFQHGTLLDDARRFMTLRALAVPEVTHTMWVDADMTFAPDAVRRLLAHDLPIVGGLCFERRPPYAPTLWRDGAQLRDYSDGLVEVDSTGGAFLLVKREVYEHIGEEFEATGWWLSSATHGLPGERRAGDECFLARAKMCGYKVFVDTTVKTGHVASVVVDEDFYKMWRASQE